jgi:pyruvate,water dikinase
MSKILWFQECTFQNSNLVGGKSSSLGELHRIPQINSADGFAITTEFYDDLLRNNSINLFIESFYTETVAKSPSLSDLNKLSEILKSKIKECNFTKDQEDLLKKFYREMPTPVELAVRSSAIAEDLPNASFAGQQDTYLNLFKYSFI